MAASITTWFARVALVVIASAACSDHSDPGPVVTPPTFADVTPATGIAGTMASEEIEMNPGPGITATDLDGDGLPELLVGYGTNGTRLLSNRGGLAFDDVTVQSGLSGDEQTLTPMFADLDNDGDPDIVLGTAAADRVFENRGGTFVDVTEGAGLGDGWTRVVLAADFDGDGLLDVFASVADDTDAPGHHRLFRNLGGLVFEDVSVASGIASESISHVAAAADIDRDGDLDLLVATDALVFDAGGAGGGGGRAPNGRDLYFRNGGVDLSFDEVATEVGLADGRSSMGITVTDVDGDTFPDLYITDFGENDMLVQVDGVFDERSLTYGIDATRRTDGDCSESSSNASCLLVSWGTALTDIDCDGYDDVIVANGHVPPWDQLPQPVAAYIGSNTAFTAADIGIDALFGRGIVPLDLDNDGDEDLVIATSLGPVRVFENESGCDDKGWLKIALQGSTSNRDGVGATVTVRLEDGLVLRRYVGAGGGYRTAPSSEVHVGLGHQAVAGIDIEWPSGTIQSLGPVESDQRVIVVEDDGAAP